MATKNDITGDAIQTKLASDLYRQNWDKIFGKKDKKKDGPKRTRAARAKVQGTP
jgi:hypothetical protein